jgi:hypothetical protein
VGVAGAARPDPAPLLEAQRARFEALAQRLTSAADEAEAFDRVLLLWRLENTNAAIRFTEAMLAGLVRSDA